MASAMVMNQPISKQWTTYLHNAQLAPPAWQNRLIPHELHSSPVGQEQQTPPISHSRMASERTPSSLGKQLSESLLTPDYATTGKNKRLRSHHVQQLNDSDRSYTTGSFDNILEEAESSNKSKNVLPPPPRITLEPVQVGLFSQKKMMKTLSASSMVGPVYGPDSTRSPRERRGSGVSSHESDMIDIHNIEEGSTSPSGSYVSRSSTLSINRELSWLSLIHNAQSARTPEQSRRSSSTHDSFVGQLVSWAVPWEAITLGKEIGVGGYGLVHRAEWNGEEVAVKVLKQSVSWAGDFAQEAASLFRLRHPRIVLSMGLCITSPLAIITEYMAGGSLRSRLAEPIKISLTQRVLILLDVAKAVNYLHMLKPPMAHRDISSGNVLLDEHGRAKLSDFGLSSLLYVRGDTEVQTQGSCRWLSPEALHLRIQELEADIYAFGVLMWEVWTADIPYRELNDAEVIEGVGFRRFPPQFGNSQGLLRPPVPADMVEPYANLMQSCWEEVPTDRKIAIEIVEELKLLSQITHSLKQM